MEPQWKALSKRAISDAQAARFLQHFVRKHGAAGLNGPTNNPGRNNLHGRESSHIGFHTPNTPQHGDGIPNPANPKGIGADARAVYQSVANAAATSAAASANASTAASAATSAAASAAAVKSEGHRVPYGNGSQ